MVIKMFLQNKTGLSQIQRNNGKTTKIRNFIGLLIISLAFFLPTMVQAQINSLKSGDRIKISLSVQTANQRTMVGTVDGVSPSVLTLITKDSTYSITNKLIENLWVSEGKRRYTSRGALIGAISGRLILGITTVATNPDPNTAPCDEESLIFCGIDLEFSNSEAFVLGAVVGTVVGGTVGAIIGTVIRTERWELLPLNISVDMQPKHKTREYGLNPTLSLRFSIGK